VPVTTRAGTNMIAPPMPPSDPTPEVVAAAAARRKGSTKKDANPSDQNPPMLSGATESVDRGACRTQNRLPLGCVPIPPIGRSAVHARECIPLLRRIGALLALRLDGLRIFTWHVGESSDSPSGHGYRGSERTVGALLTSGSIAGRRTVTRGTRRSD
jgi:hypothetical protein